MQEMRSRAPRNLDHLFTWMWRRETRIIRMHNLIKVTATLLVPFFMRPALELIYM